MKSNHRRAALLALVAACALASVPLDAQQPRVPPQGPPTPAQPGVAAEQTPPAEQPEPERVFRYSRPVFRLGQNYTVRADESVRHVVTVLGDVTIDGQVDEDVIVTLGSVRLGSSARVGGALVVVGGSALADEGATVRRDVVVVGGTLTAARDVLSSHGEQVIVGTPALGEWIESVIPWLTRGLLLGRLIVPGIGWMWWAITIFFLVYLAINTIFDRPVRACADVLTERPLSAFLLGLLVMLLTVPVLAILAASVIGLVVVPFVLCAVVAAAVIGKVSVLRAIGRGIVGGVADGRLGASVAFVIGFIVLSLAYMVPVLGVLTWALTSLLGLGAAAVAFRSSLRRERPPVPASVEPVVVPPPVAAVPVTTPEGVAVAAVGSQVYEAPPIESAPIPPPPLAAGEGLAKYPRAAFLDRVAAFALDCILVALANTVVFDLSRYEGMFPFLLLVYHMAFWTWRGTTLGGIIVSLRVVRTHGAELRPVDAVVRGLSGIFSIAALGIGCLWMLQDAEKQMWHDKIAGTIVVKVPRDLVLP